MQNSVLVLDTFEDLLAYLRRWRSWSDSETYDFVGMLHILAACLDNLHACSLEAELEEIGCYLDEEQKSFLKKLASHCDEVQE